MIIEHASQLSPDAIAHCDFSFEVTTELVMPYEALQARPVAPYRKAYEFDVEQFAHVGADQVLLVARDAGRGVWVPAGVRGLESLWAGR
ncbi:hypothetical protein [Pseudomonas sp.]|uniref:hypothetical protein n=1 Tax=Pseudomonas sp. TaxID=306 RepID=UPI003D0D5990